MIRHARPIRIDGGDGPADPSLNPEGVEQAAALCDWWAPFGADGLVSSPMARAVETAAPLAAAWGYTPTVVDDIREYDAHMPTYVPVEEMQADPAIWQAVVEQWLSPEAELERQAFRERVVVAIDEVAASFDGADRLAIVCHGGVINAYVTRALNLPGTMIFEPFYTSVTRLMWRDGHRQVVSMNEAPHLGAPRRPAVSL